MKSSSCGPGITGCVPHVQIAIIESTYAQPPRRCGTTRGSRSSPSKTDTIRCAVPRGTVSASTTRRGKGGSLVKHGTRTGVSMKVKVFAYTVIFALYATISYVWLTLPFQEPLTQPTASDRIKIQKKMKYHGTCRKGQEIIA